MTTVSAMRSPGCRCIVAREHNVVRVDFSREPDPPAPRFPGARGARAPAAAAGHTAAVARFSIDREAVPGSYQKNRIPACPP